MKENWHLGRVPSKYMHMTKTLIFCSCWHQPCRVTIQSHSPKQSIHVHGTSQCMRGRSISMTWSHSPTACYFRNCHGFTMGTEFQLQTHYIADFISTKWGKNRKLFQLLFILATILTFLPWVSKFISRDQYLYLTFLSDKHIKHT